MAACRQSKCRTVWALTTIFGVPASAGLVVGCIDMRPRPFCRPSGVDRHAADRQSRGVRRNRDEGGPAQVVAVGGGGDGGGGLHRLLDSICKRLLVSVIASPNREGKIP